MKSRLGRLWFIAFATTTLLMPALTAVAVDLDQMVCENDLGGTWLAGSSTCDVGFAFILVDPLVVPDGVTLLADVADAFDIHVENFGTIVIGDDWHNHGLLDNYGSFTATFMIHDTVVNHCGSSYDVDFDDSLSTTFLDCSVLSTVTPDPTSGVAPLAVDWIVTLSNDGDDDLAGIAVELSDDGGATAFATLVDPPDSGDDGDGVLEPGETWEWVVQTLETEDTTLTATVSGTALSGLVVTFPDDPEARSAASVTVQAATTTTTSTTSTSLPSTTVTTASPGTTATSAEVGAVTLPFTGAQGSSGIALLAMGLGSLGLLVLATAWRRQPED